MELPTHRVLSAGRDLLGAREAASYMDVKLPTLYTYVSRGWIRSVPSPGGRGRLYLREDVERVRARHDARAGHAPAAAAALQSGSAVLDSALTAIEPDGPRYRGHLAVALARSGVTFEAVSELLWTGSLPASPPSFTAAWPLVEHLGVLRAAERALADDGAVQASPLSALLLGVTLPRGRRDPEALGDQGAEAIAEARGLLPLLAALPALLRGSATVARALGISGVAARLAVALGCEAEGVDLQRRAALLDQALVLSADHELDASTFAARIAASAGSGLYACVTAALATLGGPKHGGVCDRIEETLEDLDACSDVPLAASERLRAGEAIPGFGHPLYAQGDPRAAFLLEASEALGQGSPALERLLSLAAAMRALGLPPTLEIGLAAVSLALGLTRGSASAILAVGRTAGLTAHVLEEWARDRIIRPRARYVGPAGEPRP